MRKSKILLVDDYPENIQALRPVIAAPDVEVFSANNANEALNLLTMHEFALALLDIQMPVINGIELAQLIRGVKKFKNLPIIFITANHEDGPTVFQGYDSGAVDLLFKPVNPHIVRSKVRVFVQLDQAKSLMQEQMTELNRLRLEANAANLAKSQFLANMSHEIRTPLNAIMGFSDMLGEPALEGKDKRHFIQQIRRNGEQLVRIIDDILDLSKVEAGKILIDRKTVSVPELVQQVTSVMEMRAEEKEIKFLLKVETAFPKEIVTDDVRVKQILMNLLGNAIKFTPARGEVELRLSLTPNEARGTSSLRFCVRDTGIGIPKEKQHHLFQAFSQIDSTQTRKFGGTGLGLALSRRLAQQLHGQLDLLGSDPGQRTEFELCLDVGDLKDVEMVHSIEPAHAPEIAQPKTNSQHHRLRGKKILLVEDSEDNQEIFKFFLNSAGVHVAMVSNGLDAVQAAHDPSIDMILMDIQLPGIDGKEATQLIRKQGFKKPILALTAHAMIEEQEECLRAGCNGQITKPINHENLLEKISSFMPV